MQTENAVASGSSATAVNGSGHVSRISPSGRVSFFGRSGESFPSQTQAPRPLHPRSIMMSSDSVLCLELRKRSVVAYACFGPDEETSPRTCDPAPSMSARSPADALEAVAQKWRALAERRRAHFVELYDSGRWKHYYNETQFLCRLREAIRLTERWIEIAPPRADEATADQAQLLVNRHRTAA